MNLITEQSVAAFLNGKKFSKSNMRVEVEPNVTVLKYQGNAIAYKYNDPKNTISITNCGWETNTTRERLNGVILESIYSGLISKDFKRIKQKNWVWYLDGKEWDGKLIDLN